MRILGISAYYHDSAAGWVVDGHVVAAAQEERSTRRKHDDSFPRNAIEYCLREGKTNLADLDAVVFYEKPFLKFERHVCGETFVEIVAYDDDGKSFGAPLHARVSGPYEILTNTKSL